MSGRFGTSLLLLIVLFGASALDLRAQQKTVLTDAFENQTGERGLDWLGDGLAILMAERLTGQGQLYVFGMDERTAAYERLGIPETVRVSRATALKVGWDMGADILISGRFSGTHQDFRIDARVLDLVGASHAVELSVSGRLDDVMTLSAALASKLVRELVPGATMPESDYAAQPPIPRSAFEAYVRGMLASDPQRHLELLQEAIRLHPQYTSATYQLGQSQYLDSNYKASAALLEKISAVSPEYPLARFMLAMDYYRLGDANRASAVFATLRPTYDVLVNLGAALALKGDPAGAEGAWQRAMTLRTDGAEAAFNLAHLAFVRNDTDLAASRLTQFLRTHGRDAEALFLLSRVREKAGRVDDAQRLVTQATRLSPRLERWVGATIPNLTRLRTQFDATELRLPPGVTLWTEERVARKSAVLDSGAR